MRRLYVVVLFLAAVLVHADSRVTQTGSANGVIENTLTINNGASPDATYSETGIAWNTASAVTYALANSGGGGVSLTVNGGNVPTSTVANAQVAYGSSGALTSEASFGYVAGTDTLTVGNAAVTSAATVGTTLSVGGGGLTISSTGDITAIRGVTTTFPSANAAGVLTNNGSGTLSWTAPSLANQTASSSATYNPTTSESNATGVADIVPGTTGTWFLTSSLQFTTIAGASQTITCRVFYGASGSETLVANSERALKTDAGLTSGTQTGEIVLVASVTVTSTSHQVDVRCVTSNGTGTGGPRSINLTRVSA